MNEYIKYIVFFVSLSSILINIDAIDNLSILINIDMQLFTFVVFFLFFQIIHTNIFQIIHTLFYIDEV